MRKIDVYHVDAFTDQAFGGNPAGVIPEAGDLSMEEMQKIANELNLSESAFLFPSNNPEADFRIRYFTPAEEIDFCGHATIGMSWILATAYDWADKVEQVILETNAGLVPVKWVKENNQLTAVSMTQRAPQLQNVEDDPVKIAELVGVKLTDLDDRYPIKISNTGVSHLLVPIKSRLAIDTAEPKLKRLQMMNKQYQVSTTHLFTFDTDGEFDIYTRDFCPNIGIDEDPVTGAANGALAGYLYLEGFVSNHETHQFKIGQGHAINRPGTLYVTITPHEDKPIIEVAGSAVTTIEGTITI
ncbi:PhzF family phenazine biosynthesis protein [Radiobacillus sp. PE A8.2]|uniref:PhzF family phenazine biosynthesis protein n=1 Tax=Radiobacillus sp. PE A8.2 TaxID=3380349 RepID=UPI00389041BB